MECTHCRKWHFQGILSCPTAPKTFSFPVKLAEPTQEPK